MKILTLGSLKVLAAFALSLSLVSVAQARETGHMFPIEDVLTEYEDRIHDDVALYWGDQSHPEVVDRHGEFPTNKKTNAFGKSDEEACRWVMLSAILALQERAQKEGGNAVINIRSYYDKNEVSSETEYECEAGNVIAGVALIGEVVTLKE